MVISAQVAFDEHAIDEIAVRAIRGCEIFLGSDERDRAHGLSLTGIRDLFFQRVTLIVTNSSVVRPPSSARAQSV